jgi:hypothetical protein
MRERKERERDLRARERARQRRASGSGSDGEEDEAGEEEHPPSPPPFDPETSVFASPLADEERQAAVERGEALAIALHLVLEFDGGGTFGEGAAGSGGAEDARGGEGGAAPAPSACPLPPPIRIVRASSRWLAAVSAYPLSGAEAGDVVRLAAGLAVVGGGGGGKGGGSRGRGGAAGEGERGGEEGGRRRKDLARSLALSGAVLPRRPGGGLSL